jgi:drug/metabolite transporter (DMT)-like permease
MLWVVYTVLGFLFWAHYGIGAKFSSLGYDHASELTFVWVCLVYGLGGTTLALVLSKIHDKQTVFPAKAKGWAAMAGVVGAGGAVCVISAMKFGNPLYVMPLVFGPAQAFNVLFTKLLQGFKRSPNLRFWLGLGGLVIFSILVQALKTGTEVDGLEGGSWLVWALLAAACWGMYGVASRLAVMHSAQASGGHGSHHKVLLGVSLVYAVFGVGTWLFGAVGLSTAITGETLLNSSDGIIFGLLTGIAGMGGAAFVIPANSVKGSPGPIVVMAIVFMGAAAVNAIASAIWESLYLDVAPNLTAPFLLCLAGLAVSGLVFSLNSPNKPPKPA